MKEYWIVRSRYVSFSISTWVIITMTAMALVAAMLLFLALSAGQHWLSLKDMLVSNDSEHQIILQTLRLPRALMAALVGVGLATSGLILQSVIRNPLASPDVVGITSGASAAAVAFLSFFQIHYGIEWLPIFAIGGACLAALLVYLLAWRNGVSPMRMISVGIGISAVMAAITTFVISISSTSTSISAYIWLTGSVYGSNWSDVIALLPWIAIGLGIALFFSRRINTLELGDNLAISLGLSVQKTRLALVLLSVVLAAPAVAHAGAVGFVGLIAPHIARRLVSRSFAILLPATALIGACLVIVADLFGRLLFQPLDIPAGVFVSAIGAPFFIYLLFKQRF